VPKTYKVGNETFREFSEPGSYRKKVQRVPSATSPMLKTTVSPTEEWALKKKAESLNMLGAIQAGDADAAQHWATKFAIDAPSQASILNQLIMKALAKGDQQKAKKK
jgi:hypothetical protein